MATGDFDPEPIQIKGQALNFRALIWDNITLTAYGEPGCPSDSDTKKTIYDSMMFKRQNGHNMTKFGKRYNDGTEFTDFHSFQLANEGEQLFCCDTEFINLGDDDMDDDDDDDDENDGVFGGMLGGGRNLADFDDLDEEDNFLQN